MTEIAIAERDRAATKTRNISRKGAKVTTLSRVEGCVCHFDRREKSFLDPSLLLGMTGHARHLAFLARVNPRFVWPRATGNS